MYMYWHPLSENRPSALSGMYIYICIYIYVYIFMCSMPHTGVVNTGAYMRTCFMCFHASTNRYLGCRACMQTYITCAGG